ncbi:ventrally expressed dharma/bozozok antagonist [Electrophorus electricus]|uniref:ventrally expressed dharma/bozozok antagonist n=1 Tax=Electrophorus electricus TaxID=8005 RepID=UPI0015D031F7|nr:ventrally expressed dharma/bozozok antagonist [Electrophorus electricus]
MMGRFSVEWLSQSSQAPRGLSCVQPSSSWISVASDDPSTSGTVPESLPGFYGWSLGSTEAHQNPEPARPVQSVMTPSKQEKNTSNTERLHVSELGFSSSTEEEETSGYESEGGRSLSPSTSKEAAPPSASPGTGRRARTAFTAEQIDSLERAFKRNAYLGAQEKAELCKRLSLSDKQIRNWFQNRRMKLKRTVQDALAHACQANVASQLMHYPELQPFRPAPYPCYYPPQETPTPYLCPPSLHYGPPAAAPMPALPASALYQYRSPQGLSVPAGSPALVPPFQPYHHQYFTSQ